MDSPRLNRHLARVLAAHFGFLAGGIEHELVQLTLGA
jgi:hypothetical protein